MLILLQCPNATQRLESFSPTFRTISHCRASNPGYDLSAPKAAWGCGMGLLWQSNVWPAVLSRSQPYSASSAYRVCFVAAFSNIAYAISSLSGGCLPDKQRDLWDGEEDGIQGRRRWRTGNVGREMLDILAERQFPVDEVVAIASTRSIGTEVCFGDKILKCKCWKIMISAEPTSA